MTGPTLRSAALYLAVFAGGFAGAFATRSQSSAEHRQKPLAHWLGLDPASAEAIREGDPDFEADLARLRGAYEEARLRLARLFDKADTSDNELRTQIEAVIRTHNAVERRVAEHLLIVREHLTPAQQKRLFELCAEQVRAGRQHRHRHGWQQGGHPGRGERRGRHGG